MPIKILRFDPTKDDLERWLPMREAQIMALFWDLAIPMTIKRLHKEMEYYPSLTAVSTPVRRLVRKGLLAPDRVKLLKGGIAAKYLPTCSLDEFINTQENAICASLSLEYNNAENSLR